MCRRRSPPQPLLLPQPGDVELEVDLSHQRLQFVQATAAYDFSQREHHRVGLRRVAECRPCFLDETLGQIKGRAHTIESNSYACKATRPARIVCSALARAPASPPGWRTLIDEFELVGGVRGNDEPRSHSQRNTPLWLRDSVVRKDGAGVERYCSRNR